MNIGKHTKEIKQVIDNLNTSLDNKNFKSVSCSITNGISKMIWTKIYLAIRNCTRQNKKKL